MSALQVLAAKVSDHTTGISQQVADTSDKQVIIKQLKAALASTESIARDTVEHLQESNASLKVRCSWALKS